MLTAAVGTNKAGSARIKAAHRVGSILLSMGHPQFRIVRPKQWEPYGTTGIIQKREKRRIPGKAHIMEVQTLQSLVVDPEQQTGMDWSLGAVGTKKSLFIILFYFIFHTDAFSFF